MGRPFKCPYCAASRSIAKGCRTTKTLGRRVIRLCRACGRKFTPRAQKPGATTITMTNSPLSSGENHDAPI